MNTLSLYNLEQKKYRYIDFSEPFAEAFGNRERGGIWIVYGKSGHGKTSFVFSLAKEFDRLGMRVLFVTLEMGFCSDFQSMLLDADIRSTTSDIQFCDSLTADELADQMKKQRSPDVVIIDSLQYFSDQYGATAEQIIDLRKKFRNKIFIYVSHVEGREVEGKVAYHVKRDSFVRIQVEGFRAIYRGRGKAGPRGYYTVWEEGAANYWLQNDKKQSEDEQQENESDQQGDDRPSARTLPAAGPEPRRA